MKTSSPAIHVTPCPIRWHDGRMRISAQVTGHPGWRIRRRNGLMYFEVPDPWSEHCVIRDEPADVHDVWLRATVFSAMEAGRTLSLHGRVSPRLLKNIQEYQQIIHRWWPWYRPVEIQVDEVANDRSQTSSLDKRPAILGYSGGLDSTFSLYVHKMSPTTEGDSDLDRQLANGTQPDADLPTNGSLEAVPRHGRVDIGLSVFVHGFDVPLRDETGFREAFERARRVTDDAGVPLVPVRCNLRDMLPWWPHSCGAAIAAVLSLFERDFSPGIVASGDLSKVTSDGQIANIGFGTTPWSDPLLSSDRFPILHDGHGTTRVQKTTVLRDWTAARQNLRVCWEGKNHARNCGRCEKCVRQMLCMIAAGIDDLSAFDARPTPKLIRKPKGLIGALFFSGSCAAIWEECYRHAKLAGTADTESMVALKQALVETGQRRFSLRQLSRQYLAPLVARIY